MSIEQQKADEHAARIERDLILGSSAATSRETPSPAAYEERYRLLQNLYDELQASCARDRADAEAENQRLRDALQRIATANLTRYKSELTFARRMRKIAREALAGDAE